MWFKTDTIRFDSVPYRPKPKPFDLLTSRRAGRDFWTGGLNPGLLWIWANSARPVTVTGHNNHTSNAINNPGGGGGGEEIQGNGRCLKLAHNPATRQYNYQGGDCSARYRFICQLEEPSASRALSRIRKALNIHLDGDSDPDSDPPPSLE